MERSARWNDSCILPPCINYQIDTCKISFLHSHSESYFVRNEALSKKLKTYLFTRVRRGGRREGGIGDDAMIGMRRVKRVKL